MRAFPKKSICIILLTMIAALSSVEATISMIAKVPSKGFISQPVLNPPTPNPTSAPTPQPIATPTPMTRPNPSYNQNLDSYNNVLYASSGSASAIQSAVNQAKAGDAVLIPEGTFTFSTQSSGVYVTVPTGVSIFGAPPIFDFEGNIVSWGTNLHLNVDNSEEEYVYWFVYVGFSHYLTRFSGINMVGHREFAPSTNDVTNGIILNDGVGTSQFRIDHVRIRSLGGFGVQACGGYGVIDHCDFSNNNAQLTYGNMATNYNYCTGKYHIVAEGHGDWASSISQIAGKYTDQTWVIEDCFFKRSISLSSIASCHMIVRHSQFVDCKISAHWATPEWGGTPTRLIESYNNTFTYEGHGGFGSLGHNIESGSAIIYNNINYGFGGGSNSNSDYNCFIALRQSQADDMQYTQIEECYIWNNQMSSNEDLLDVLWGEEGATPDKFIPGSNPIMQNEHYFLRKPSYSQDGWTYTPLQYPHSLVKG